MKAWYTEVRQVEKVIWHVQRHDTLMIPGRDNGF